MSDKFQGGVKAGSASVSIDCVLRKAADNTELTGIVFGGVTAYYHRQGAAPVAITTATLALATTAYASGGFIELDATHTPGLYRFDVPDAAFATGADFVTVSLLVGTAFVFYERYALTTNAVQTGDNYARLGAPAGASVSADVAAVKSDTAALVSEEIILTGTASAGSSTTITLTGGIATDHIYEGEKVEIVSGTGAKQVRTITGYVGSTKVATVSPAWTTAPDNTSAFNIIQAVAATLTMGQLPSNGLDLIVVETGINARQALELAAAAAAGVLSGATTSTVAIAAAGSPSTPRISASVDGSGNRTAVTLTV